MKKRITIKDVAREAGVSIALVSMALNSRVGKDGKSNCKVKQETISRIREVSERLGYIPNNAAAQISSGRSRTIGVITSIMDSQFFTEICKHIERYAYSAGYSVILSSADENAGKLYDAVHKAVGIGVDGMLVIPPAAGAEIMEAARDLHIPVVFLERDMPDYSPAGRVLLDNEKACMLAVKGLKDNGYTRIEQLTMDLEVTTVISKKEYYLKAMDELGLSDFAHISTVPEGITTEDLVKLIAERLECGAEAFFIPSNDLTVSVLGALRNMGLKTPDDVAIVGFDSCSIFDLHSPSIAHIKEPTEEFARHGFDLLMGMMSGEDTPRTLLLEPTFVPGGSSSRR